MCVCAHAHTCYSLDLIYIYMCVCMYSSAPLAKNMFLASPLAVTNANVLKWNERLQIAVDAANGLETV